MSADLIRYLDLLFGAEPDGAFVELRWRRCDRAGMGQLWSLVERKAAVTDSILAIGNKTDLYVGCAPRVRRYGGREAVERAHVLWADCDTAESLAALERFSPVPSMVNGSGSGRHAYWSLFPPAPATEVERANRRLAHALGADTAATDAARILRPPGTHNHKTGEPVPVTLEHLDVEVYVLEQVIGDLGDPPVRRRAPRAPVSRPAPFDDPLSSIPPPVYVELLTGAVVGQDGKVCCPFHEDRTPSLHVYDHPADGFYCYGCQRGGSIYDFGAALYGLEPRGPTFCQLRRRLAAELLGRVAA